MSEKSFEALSGQYFQMLANVRQQVVPIVDAFDLNERELRSCLGRKDGRVYESLFQSALKSPMNQSDVS